MPLLSFIIPCYNVQKCIKSCIKSIINACNKLSPSTYEIITINDGSTDNTLEELINIKENHPSINIQITNTTKQGVSSARNQGIEASKGSWIWFVDADDTLDKNSESLLYQIALYKDKCEAIAFGYSLYEKGKQHTQHPVKFDKEEQIRILSDINIREELLPYIAGLSQKSLDRLYCGKSISDQDAFAGTVWHYIFKRSIIDKHHLRFSTNLILNEDGMFVLEYLAYTKTLIACNTIGYKYNLSSNGSLYRILSNSHLLSNHKIIIAEVREAISKRIQRDTQINIRPLYAASFILSAIELAVKSDGGKNYAQYKKYINLPFVKSAIRSISHKNAPLKYKIPFMMLQHNLHFMLYYTIQIIQFLGFHIVGNKSIFK